MKFVCTGLHLGERASTNVQLQARYRVILEAGFLVDKYGRSTVCWRLCPLEEIIVVDLKIILAAF